MRYAGTQWYMKASCLLQQETKQDPKELHSNGERVAIYGNNFVGI